MKKTIKLALSRRSHGAVRDYALAVYNGLNGNALYPAPVIALILYLTYINALSDAITNWGTPGNRGSKSDHNTLLSARSVVELAMLRLSVYCISQTVYDGDAFTNAGWEIKNAPGAVVPLPAPTFLRQEFPNNLTAGQAKLKCNKVDGVKLYLFSREPVAPETANVEYFSSATTTVVQPLISGQLYRFRVAAIGPLGVGVWSDVCEVKIL